MKFTLNFQKGQSSDGNQRGSEWKEEKREEEQEQGIGSHPLYTGSLRVGTENHKDVWCGLCHETLP